MNNNPNNSGIKLRKRTIRLYDFVNLPWSYMGLTVYGYNHGSRMDIKAWRDAINKGHYSEIAEKTIKSIRSDTSDYSAIIIELNDN